jgi:hypothetical protein
VLPRLADELAAIDADLVLDGELVICDEIAGRNGIASISGTCCATRGALTRRPKPTPPASPPSTCCG